MTVDNKLISQIGQGLMVLVGISRNDTQKDAKKLVNKVLNMRLWPDKDNNPWKTNVVQNQFEILFGVLGLYHSTVHYNIIDILLSITYRLYSIQSMQTVNI